MEKLLLSPLPQLGGEWGIRAPYWLDSSPCAVGILLLLMSCAFLYFYARQLSSSSSSATSTLATSALQAQVARGESCRTRILSLLEEQLPYLSVTHVEEVKAQLVRWTNTIQRLVRQVDGFHRNPVIRENYQALPSALVALEKQLEDEDDPTMRRKVASTLASRQQQWQTLEQLHMIMRNAELEIEHALSALETIYLQLLTSQSTGQLVTHELLTTKLDEQVSLLEGYLTALKEVM